jgi:hypothetical protein
MVWLSLQRRPGDLGGDRARRRGAAALLDKTEHLSLDCGDGTCDGYACEELDVGVDLNGNDQFN